MPGRADFRWPQGLSGCWQQGVLALKGREWEEQGRREGRGTASTTHAHTCTHIYTHTCTHARARPGTLWNRSDRRGFSGTCLPGLCILL